MAFRRLVGTSGMGKELRFWYTDDGLYSVGLEGEHVVEKPQIVVPVITVAEVEGRTIVADVQEIQTRENGQWRTWYGPGLRASDVLVMRDTVVIVSIDPGETEEEQVATMILLRSDGTAIAVRRELYRSQEGSVYTWMVPTHAGLLHRAGDVLRLSSDAGRTWSSVPGPLTDMTKPVVLGGVVWSAGKVDGQVAICWSTDGGRQWEIKTVGIPDLFDVSSIALTANTIVLATQAGLFECDIETVSALENHERHNPKDGILYDLTGERCGELEHGRTDCGNGMYVLWSGRHGAVVLVQNGHIQAQQ
jgi:hypothetical protein